MHEEWEREKQKGQNQTEGKKRVRDDEYNAQDCKWSPVLEKKRKEGLINTEEQKNLWNETGQKQRNV